MENDDSEVLLKEARVYLEASWHATDDQRYDVLRGWSKEILEPLVGEGNPEAEFLLGYLDDITSLSKEEMHARELQWLRKAADSGIVNAQFRLACELDEDGTREESARLFKHLAEKGHAYAQWCHGLNLLAGLGLPQDETAGVAFIVRAAEGRFEGAIKWMADVHAQGTYGFKQDEGRAAEWMKKLGRGDTIPY